MSTLNSSQLEAVKAAEGPLILAAGPGTGKTRTFAHKVAYLIQEKGIKPENILALTFTRSAAGEMKERLQALVAADLGRLWVETFHAAALRLLREQEYPFGPGVLFSVASEEEKPTILEGLLPSQKMPALLAEIRRAKQALVLPQEGAAAEYQKRLLLQRLLDFDDLFIYSLRLLGERPQVLESYRRRFLYILVDEFQDTSFAQYELLRRLAGGNLCVIGDPDQAIYGFAGDGFNPFERFKQDYTDHRILPLSENYRSKAAILEAAKQVIGKNRAQLPRALEARLKGGLPVEILPHLTERQEAEMIVRKIEGLLGGASTFTIDSLWAEKEEESYSYGLADIAILYRFHAQARALQEALDRAGLPCRVFGKPAPAEDLEDFVSREQVTGEAITLMTLHRSKGLEFPIVFLAGCADRVLPFHRGELEAERRLFYVGMTRAKSRLFISYAGKPSPFVSDIEEELRVLRESQAPAKKRPAKASQPSLFEL